MKRFLLVGTLLLGLAACFCDLSASTKAKTDDIISYNDDSGVSRETVVKTAFTDESIVSIQKDAIITSNVIDYLEAVQNDTYLERSAEWIRANNIDTDSRWYYEPLLC
ncbi:MAG: hypothetical protein QM762_12610 [Chryseolinea sp.]